MIDSLPRRRVLFLVAVGVAVQVVIPTVQLARGAGLRYGWQMFAQVPPARLYLGERVDGALDTLDVLRHFAFFRADVTDAELAGLPGHLCRVRPELAAVMLVRPTLAPRDSTRVPCD